MDRNFWLRLRLNWRNSSTPIHTYHQRLQEVRGSLQKLGTVLTGLIGSKYERNIPPPILTRMLSANSSGHSKTNRVQHHQPSPTFTRWSCHGGVWLYICKFRKRLHKLFDSREEKTRIRSMREYNCKHNHKISFAQIPSVVNRCPDDSSNGCYEGNMLWNDFLDNGMMDIDSTQLILVPRFSTILTTPFPLNPPALLYPAPEPPRPLSQPSSIPSCLLLPYLRKPTTSSQLAAP